jgi:hypothetical protein
VVLDVLTPVGASSVLDWSEKTCAPSSMEFSKNAQSPKTGLEISGPFMFIFFCLSDFYAATTFERFDSTYVLIRIFGVYLIFKRGI